MMGLGWLFNPRCPNKVRDPIWWTKESGEGWSRVPTPIAEKMKGRLRWICSISGFADLNGGIQMVERVEYWGVQGCPVCLKGVTPQYYDRGDWSHGDPKWFVHDVYFRWPPQDVSRETQ